MHWFRVVNHRRNAFSFQGGLEGVALSFVFQTEGVLRPAGAEAGRDDRGGDDVLEALRVAVGGNINGIQLILGEGHRVGVARNYGY